MGVLAPDAARLRALDRRIAWQVALGALGMRVASRAPRPSHLPRVPG